MACGDCPTRFQTAHHRGLAMPLRLGAFANWLERPARTRDHRKQARRRLMASNAPGARKQALQFRRDHVAQPLQTRTSAQ